MIAQLFLLLILQAEPYEELLEFQPGLPEELLKKEVIEELIRNPLDLNQANRDELLKIPYLDPVLVDRIIKYRSRAGGFSALNELSRIPGFDEDLIQRLSLFLKIGAKEIPVLGQIRTRLRSESLPGRFLNQSLYSRARFDLGRFKFGALIEKDPGESSILDFYSLNGSFEGIKDRIMLGDYYLTAGQGLIFSTPFAFITGPEPSLEIGQDELEAQLSPNENFGFRGAAFKHQFKALSASLFLSHNQLDARLNPDSTAARILYDGVHDDEESRAALDQLKESLIGGRLSYDPIHLGLSGYHNRYHRALAPDDSIGSFYGDRLTLLGLDFAWLLKNYYIFGEAAHSLGYGWASILGLNGHLDPVRIGFNVRGYQANFFSPHSRSYSLYNRQDRLDYYFSIWTRLAGIRAGIYGSIGHDFDADSLAGRYTVQLSHRRQPFELSLQLKESFQEETVRYRGSRFHLRWDGIKKLIFDIRLEDRYRLAQPIKRGLLGFIELWFNEEKFDLRIRGYRFDIPSEVGISAYEYAPSGLGRSHSLDGQGFRIFMMGSLSLKKTFEAAIRYGYTKTDETNSDLGLQITLNY